MHTVHCAAHPPFPPFFRTQGVTPSKHPGITRAAKGGVRGKGGWGPPIRGWGNACGNLISYPHNPNSPRTNTKDRPPLPSPKPGGWKGNFGARGGKIGLHPLWEALAALAALEWSFHIGGTYFCGIP